MFGLGTWELLILLALGLLLFGRRLPEVGRSLGKGIVEFKKGIRGIEDEVDQGTRQSTPRQSSTLPPSESATPAPRVDQPMVQGQDVRVSRSDAVN
ncbi:MAG: twin-arginine translocase TatA/TatE family subunit [Phycisphaeraceae bacterium]|nr:twin-arginine translocase TatA/TatE family subunit [Phycisphaeraceae bacterium]MBX3408132.1 twin-arginine translocase TatA/TatE family subunit [Phycisphaeraceae bacterium]